VLAALARAVAVDAGFPVATMSTSLSMGLYSTHVMVPPTPGPLAAAGSLGADLGRVMGLGLLVALPAALAGVAYATYAGRRLTSAPATGGGGAGGGTGPGPSMPPPPAARAWMPILVPVAMIALASVAALPSQPLGARAAGILAFAGHPVVALAVLAVGAGSMVVSHANDSYFWVVGQFSGMDVGTTWRTHTVASLVSGLTALAALCGLWAWMGP